VGKEALLFRRLKTVSDVKAYTNTTVNIMEEDNRVVHRKSTRRRELLEWAHQRSLQLPHNVSGRRPGLGLSPFQIGAIVIEGTAACRKI